MFSEKLIEEIRSLKSQLVACDDERKRQALSAEIESKTLTLNLLMDSDRRARRGGKY